MAVLGLMSVGLESDLEGLCLVVGQEGLSRLSWAHLQAEGVRTMTLAWAGLEYLR